MEETNQSITGESTVGEGIEELSYFVQDGCDMDVQEENGRVEDNVEEELNYFTEEVRSSGETGGVEDNVEEELNYFTEEVRNSGETGSACSLDEKLCGSSGESADVDYTINRIPIDSVGDICSIDLKSFTEHDVVKYDFLDLEVAYKFYVHYARVNGFCVRRYNVIRSLQTGEILQQEFVCNRNGRREDRGLGWEQRQREPKRVKRCDCPAKFRVHIDIVIGRWHCTRFIDFHNHELYDDVECGLQAPHRKMSSSDVIQMNSMREVGIGVPHMFRAFANQCDGFGNIGFKKKDIYNQIGRQRLMQKNDSVTAMQFMGKLDSKDDNFYCECTIDEDRRLEHLFWSDGISRLSYQVYGDVVAFDATYSKNKYMLPLVVFSGVNNHNRTIVFAAAVVANETEETYVWLLEQFLIAMKGVAPNAVITDGDTAIKNSIRRVLPNAHHRLCSWHLLVNATSNVGNPLFTQAFKNCMYGDFDVGKFERKWNEMVAKFGLQDNSWVTSTYERRKMWATAHFRGKFFGGFRTTSRCEGLHSELGKYVHSRYNLTDFLEQFNNCLKHMRFRELDDDCESMHGDPVLKTNLKPLERSAGKHLTKEMFLLFRPVLQHVRFMRVVDREEAITYSIFTVAKSMSDASEWHVSYYPDSLEFKCSCFKMESRGLACEHIVAVLAHLNIEELPECLILRRWTKGAKDGVFSGNSIGKECWDSQKSVRCGALMDLYRVLGDLNSDSVADFNLAREKANELIHQTKAKKSCHRDGGVSFRQRDFSKLNDPLRVRTKGCGVKNTSSPGVRGKRVVNCSICKEPGHNKVTCQYRPRGAQIMEESMGVDEELNLFTTEEDVDH